MTGKLIGWIFILYLLYYVGMIIYDLFLKKGKEVEETEDLEEFSLQDIADREQEVIKHTDIDDVENITLPQSYEIHSELNEEFEKELNIAQNEQNLKELESKFKENEELENLSVAESVIEEEEKTQTENSQKVELSGAEKRKQMFKDIINLATTSIQVVENEDGYKVYKSTLI